MAAAFVATLCSTQPPSGPRVVTDHRDRASWMQLHRPRSPWMDPALTVRASHGHRLLPPPVPASRIFLKVDSSGRLRKLSTAYSPTAARATLPVECNFYKRRLQAF
ncbi:hypothetical protein ZWY2020_037464 [Hordeum vulgare]|nr:hypothetical protein ZWY2020_037464 [Hordeum vulgare]